MNILLFTKNATIEKLFSVSLEKHGMNLIKGDIKNPTLYDANVIFVDNDILNEIPLNYFNNTKKILILGKNEKKAVGFDEYMIKPFLPMDLINLIFNLNIEEKDDEEIFIDEELLELEEEPNDINDLLLDEEEILNQPTQTTQSIQPQNTLASLLNLDLESLKNSGATITITIKFDKE